MGVTSHEGTLPINSGVVFARSTPASRALFSFEWQVMSGHVQHSGAFQNLIKYEDGPESPARINDQHFIRYLLEPYAHKFHLSADDMSVVVMSSEPGYHPTWPSIGI